jgi:hypothetical protein
MVNLLVDKDDQTGRGFALVEFEDANGIKCSLQTSSALRFYEADNGGNMPYDYHLWVGCDGPNPKAFTAERKWVDWRLPDHVSCTTRMHLTPDQVRALIVHLQAWLDSEQQSFIPQEVAE